MALTAGSMSSAKEIARSIPAHDESQVEYYEGVTKNMVGRVLRGYEIVEKGAAATRLSVTTTSTPSRSRI